MENEIYENKKKEILDCSNRMRSSFNRNISKELIPNCEIMKVNVAAINMPWLLEYISQNIHRLSGDYITVLNVYSTVLAYNDNEYLRVQNSAVMAIPDGGPLSFIGKRRGYSHMSRTAGPSLMEEIFKQSKTNKYRHYFYGSTEKTLSNLKSELMKKYPEINIVGMYSPPFRQLTPDEDKAICKNINLLQPDIIWVGLGAPKQEFWMERHQGKVEGCMIGVGAGFDYFAGNIKRAPLWMQNNNLEWVYRLIQEPKRLIKKYWTTNFKFIWNAVILGK